MGSIGVWGNHRGFHLQEFAYFCTILPSFSLKDVAMDYCTHVCESNNNVSFIWQECKYRSFLISKLHEPLDFYFLL